MILLALGLLISVTGSMFVANAVAGINFLEFASSIPKFISIGTFLGGMFKSITYGTIVGRVRENPFTYLRIGTDDQTGTMRAYVGEGKFTTDPLETFGGYGVVQVPRFQELLAYICEQGFEHHVSLNQTLVARPLDEALRKYLRWPVYYHR